MTSKLAASPLTVTSEQREVLRRLSRSSSLPHRAVLQAKALLLSADGEAIYEVARRLGVAPNSVRQWRRRFEDSGVEAIGVIAPGRGRTSWLREGTVADVVATTMNELPADGSTQWSTRTMAQRMGISKDTVARIWKDHGLKPWKTDTFKVSTDPHFEEKLVDVVGLYMDPPERAVVFSFDEKT
jgi:transposase